MSVNRVLIDSAERPVLVARGDGRGAAPEYRRDHDGPVPAGRDLLDYYHAQHHPAVRRGELPPTAC